VIHIGGDSISVQKLGQQNALQNEQPDVANSQKCVPSRETPVFAQLKQFWKFKRISRQICFKLQPAYYERKKK
jgi:hypothetical protein